MLKPVCAAIFLVLGSANAMAQSDVFPPVPTWQPEFRVDNDIVLERMRFYTDEARDLAIFTNGTAVLLPDGLSDEDAIAYANEVLSRIYNAHPDMNPMPMNDGNLVIAYNHPAYNVVIASFIEPRMDEVRVRHLDGLATDELLMTPLGANVFDDLGMMALYGRSFMFMDAQDPRVEIIHRHAVDDAE